MTDVYLDPRDQGILFVAPQSESDLRVPTAEELTSQSELLNRAIINSFPQGNNNKLIIANEAIPISEAEREVAIPTDVNVFLQGHPLITYTDPYRITLPEVSANETQTLYLVGFFYEVSAEIDGNIVFSFKYRDSDGNINTISKENTRRIRSGWMLVNTSLNFGVQEFINLLTPQVDSRKYSLTVPSHTTKTGWILQSQIQGYLGSLPIKDFTYTIFRDGIQVIPLFSLDRTAGDGSPDFSSILDQNTWSESNNLVDNSNTDSTSSGSGNVVLGGFAGIDLTSDSRNNVFVGSQAGRNATAANSNVFIGYQAGAQQEDGNSSVLIGIEAGRSSTGSNNTMIGRSAGEIVTTESNNTFLGVFAGRLTVGDNNVALGAASASGIDAGSGNIAIGHVAGGVGDLTANECIVIGERCAINNDVTDNSATNRIVIGVDASAAVDNEVVLGNSAIVQWRPDSDGTCDLGTSVNKFKDIYATNATVQTSTLADKSAIAPTSLGLEFIKDLNPVQFKWKDEKDDLTHYGLILEEVEALGIDGITRESGLAYTELISPLIKAVQELSKRVAELETKVNG